MIVAGKAAGIGSPGIGDGSRSIGCDDVEVKIDEPLAGDGSACAAHAVGGVADRAGEAIVKVASMFGEAGIGHDLARVMAFSAKGVWPVDAEIGVGKEIGDQLAGRRGLTELIAALEDVRPF